MYLLNYILSILQINNVLKIAYFNFSIYLKNIQFYPSISAYKLEKMLGNNR